MASLWVLLPAFNEAANIADVVARVLAEHIEGVTIHALVAWLAFGAMVAAILYALLVPVVRNLRGRVQ